MDQHPYWQKQTIEKPLFPDFEWNKPERKSQAGKLGIIGGNQLSFVAVAESYTNSLEFGAGAARVLVPDNLKKSIPASMTDIVFGASNPSGSLAKDAATEMAAIGKWASGVLLIGDAGRNSETAILYEQFLGSYSGQLTITRDAIDLVKNSSQALVERPDTLLVASFAQLQKLFGAVYYPKVLTFSMQLAQLVEALHKFTITYPVSIMTLHKDVMIIASGGDIVTQPWDNAMAIWRGSVATKSASYLLWHDGEPLKSLTASIASN